MRRFFLYISLAVVLFCISCSPSLTRNCQKIDFAGEPIVLSAWVDGTSAVEKYNMQVDFFRNHFSGLLMIKQAAPGEYRMVFASYFGLSLFDFTLSRDTFIVNSCIEPLKKEHILALFRKDFTLLLRLNQTENSIFEKFKCEEKDCLYFVYRQKNGKEISEYCVDETGNIRSIVSGKGVRGVKMSGSEFTASHPRIVRIDHPLLKLRFMLEKVK